MTGTINPHADNYVELRFRREKLEARGLPDIGYPVRLEFLENAIINGGRPPFAAMLSGLQEKSAEGGSDWRSHEPALARLAALTAPDDPRDIIEAAGDTWWIEIGPVDLAGPIVTVQRENVLVAAIAARTDGRLRAACYRPLDAKAANYLLSLGQVPHPQLGVCMRENNWEYARDSSAGTGNFYAFQRGEAHLSWWEAGLGVMHDGAVDAHWHDMRGLPARQPAETVMELGVRYTMRV